MSRELMTVNSGLLAELKELGVNRDDIVSIHTAAVEQDLLRKQADLEQEIKDLGEELTGLNERCKTELGVFVDRATKAAKASAKATLHSLARLGFKEPTLGTVEQETGGKEELILTLNFTSGGQRYGGMELTRRIPYSKPVLLARELVGKAEEAMRKRQARLLEVKLALANIVREERSAKAALAMAALEQTEAGRAIIEKMRGVKPICA